MRNIKKLFLPLLLLCFDNVQGQVYSRKSITILMAQYTDGRPIDSYTYSNYIKVPDRFDKNDIGTTLLPISLSFNSSEDYSANQEIKDQIYQQRIPNKILKSILIDTYKDYMTVDVIKNRGLYNASDADFMVAKNSARGIDILKDAGLSLLTNIYFLVIKPTDYSYQKEDNSKANIYSFSGSATLYQLNLDSAYMAKQFWEDFYFDSPNPTMMTKLMNYRFPLKETYLSFDVKKTDLDGANKASVALQGLANLIGGTKKEIDESQLTRKSESQIKRELVEAAVKKLLNTIVEDDDFSVKASIFATHPLKAKIGKKESVRTDDLFAITENILDPKNGKKSIRNVGFIRAKWVKDNRYYTNGKTNPSSFYRAVSGKIRKGMLLSEVKESPFSMGFSYGLDNTNVLSGGIVNIEYRTHWLPGFIVGLNASYNPSATTESVTNSYTKIKGAFTGEAITGALFFKQSLNFNYLSIAPFGGVYFSYLPINGSTVSGVSSSSLSSKYPDLKSMDLGLVYGVDVGINVSRTVQIHGGYHITLSGGATTKYGENLFPYTLTYGTSTIVAGIRLFRL